MCFELRVASALGIGCLPRYFWAICSFLLDTKSIVNLLSNFILGRFSFREV